MYLIIAQRDSGNRISVQICDNLESVGTFIVNVPPADGHYEVFEVEWEEYNWKPLGPALYFYR